MTLGSRDWSGRRGIVPKHGCASGRLHPEAHTGAHAIGFTNGRRPAGGIDLTSSAPEDASTWCPDAVLFVNVHLRHHDHGSEFRRRVERAIPDCQARRDRLRRLGPDLLLPGLPELS